MSQSGGDNHFFSARERDLRPLLEEAVEALDLDEEKAEAAHAFLEVAWLSGTRNGHFKLLNQTEQARDDPTCVDPREIKPDPAQMEAIEAEFKEMMESSADALNLTVGRTISLWNLLSRAWTSGVHTYEEELMALLIERKSNIAEEAAKWLQRSEEGDGGAEEANPGL